MDCQREMIIAAAAKIGALAKKATAG